MKISFVNNYNIIDKLYAQETSTEKILKDFVNSINSKLDKSLKDFDLNSLISQLREISEKGDVENGKHKVQQSPRNKKVSK